MSDGGPLSVAHGPAEAFFLEKARLDVVDHLLLPKGGMSINLDLDLDV